MYTVDWKIKKFLKIYPEYDHLLIPFKHDQKYLVRTLHDQDGRIVEVEFGYASDRWRIPKIPMMSD